jgi:hypothetical protein
MESAEKVKTSLEEMEGRSVGNEQAANGVVWFFF